jgi:CheY-like chemotaxis protein
VAEQYEAHRQAAFCRETGCVHHVVEPLLDAHIAGVKDDDLARSPAELCACRGNINLNRRRQMRPVAHDLDAVERNSEVAGDASCEAIVDDDDAVRETATLMLKSLGFDVLAAASGKEAIRLFARHQSSLRGVLLDLSMPEMDGRDVFRALVREQPQVRVLLMSGFDRSEALRGFGSVRPQGFLQKPLHLEVLRAAIGKLLLELPARA